MIKIKMCLSFNKSFISVCQTNAHIASIIYSLNYDANYRKTAERLAKSLNSECWTALLSLLSLIGVLQQNEQDIYTYTEY